MATTNYLDLTGLTTYDGLIKTEIKKVDDKIGTLADLDTTAKTDLVTSINEVRASVEAGGTGSQVTIDTTATTTGYLKSYTIKQGTNTVGVIDIPKDIFAVSGSVVVDPDADHTGTFVKLILENQEEPLYIDVASLIDNYTAQQSATQVQLAIDTSTREISATIVAGSVGTTELTDASVTVDKIADANVTKAKLATDVTDSLDLANSALQSDDIVTGNADGTIAVNGTDVAIKGFSDLAIKVGDGFSSITSAEIQALFTS